MQKLQFIKYVWFVYSQPLCQIKSNQIFFIADSTVYSEQTEWNNSENIS